MSKVFLLNYAFIVNIFFEMLVEKVMISRLYNL